jgi:deazaflavin-dependent oxidoreductase (nitroreductase family)
VPIPPTVARFNNRWTNKVTRHFAKWLPGFAVVTHLGRVSGRRHQTPVNMFRRGDNYVFAMTYGRDADWVKNVDAAGGCEITTRGRTVRLVDPRHYTDPERGDVPSLVGTVLGWIDVDEFVSMQRPSRSEPASGDAKR